MGYEPGKALGRILAGSMGMGKRRTRMARPWKPLRNPRMEMWRIAYSQNMAKAEARTYISEVQKQ